MGAFQPKSREHQSANVMPQPARSPYQALQPAPNQSLPGPQGFRIPRRAISTSGQPVPDQWRIWDPATEQPTSEFFTFADLVFDALDSKYEPKNTGLLEACKIVASFDLQGVDYQVKGKPFANTRPGRLDTDRLLQISSRTTPTKPFPSCGA